MAAVKARPKSASSTSRFQTTSSLVTDAIRDAYPRKNTIEEEA